MMTTHKLEVRRYEAHLSNVWDAFVRGSRNGTFLLERAFMDYHSDRFADHSLMVYIDDELRGLLPANWDAKGRCLNSHQGLTYGGLIVDEKATQVEVLQMMEQVADYCRNVLQAERLVYKPIPYIYASCACEEDRYALFRLHAQLIAKGASTVVDMRNPLPMRELRRRMNRKALRSGLTIRRCDVCDRNTMEAFWQILSGVLDTRHGVRPVHTVDEMLLLMGRFPEQIRFYYVVDPNGCMLGGCVVFVTRHVAHIQYISANDEGRRLGALDMLFTRLIEKEFHDFRYLDFGISTEQGGQVLNEGLIFQKEGFGGRTVCYDVYELNLQEDNA